MKNLTYILILSSTLIFAQQFKIEHKQNDNNTVNFTYKKSIPNSVTVILELNSLNNTNSPKKIIKTIFKPQGNFLTLKPTNQEENIRFGYSYKYFNNSINPNIDREFVYILPFKKGNQMHVEELSNLGSTYSSKETPKGWKSYSFSSHEQQDIFPARKGVVIKINDGFKPDLSKNFIYSSKMNSVLIEHDDGTIASYSGFDNNKIYVETGDVVYPEINPLGKTTIFDSQKIHKIYFQIYYYHTKEGVKLSNLKSSNQTENIFITPTFINDNKKIKLQKGLSYTSDYNEETLFQNFSKKQVKKYKKGKPIN